MGSINYWYAAIRDSEPRNRTGNPAGSFDHSEYEQGSPILVADSPDLSSTRDAILAQRFRTISPAEDKDIIAISDPLPYPYSTGNAPPSSIAKITLCGGTSGRSQLPNSIRRN